MYGGNQITSMEKASVHAVEVGRHSYVCATNDIYLAEIFECGGLIHELSIEGVM